MDLPVHPMLHQCQHFKYLLCPLVIAGARPTAMDQDSDGEVDSEEKAQQMRKDAEQEKRLEAEYKDAAKAKAEEKDTQHGQATVTKGKGSKHTEYGQLLQRLGKYLYFKSLLFCFQSENVLLYIRCCSKISIHKKTFLRINISKPFSKTH